MSSTYGRRTALGSVDPQRFWERVDRRGPDECWPWLGPRVPQGYGHVSVSGIDTPSGYGTIRAHRAAWEFDHGERVPEGLTIDHLCRNKLCCNPAHLEPVTAEENYRRHLPFHEYEPSERAASVHRREQNGKVRWRVMFRLDRRQYGPTFKTEAEAEAFAAEIRRGGARQAMANRG